MSKVRPEIQGLLAAGAEKGVREVFEWLKM